MTKYALVDISNLFSRAKFVTQGNIYDKAGLAISICFNSFKKIHRLFKIDHFVFAVDFSNWREEIYPLYKSKRKSDALSRTIEEIEENKIFYEALTDLINFLNAQTNCTVLKSYKIEGDDFISRFIKLHPKDEHIIISCDSDFIQLLNDNVSIYDGINEVLIKTGGVYDKKNQKLNFEIKTNSGKLKINNKITNDFVIEEEWWKKALFIKIIRGDEGDSILSAYPRIAYKGSSKRVGIQQAWEDRKEKGFYWNNFMLQTWKKPIRNNEEVTYEDVKVIDEYNINKLLIDLTCQPEHIKQQMDETIIKACQKTHISNVGFNLLKFCHKYNIEEIIKESDYHAIYLNAGYYKG